MTLILSGNQNGFTLPITSRPNEDVTIKLANCWSMEEKDGSRGQARQVLGLGGME